MEKKIYTVTEATLDDLNDFSCKMEALKGNISMLHSLIWAVADDLDDLDEQAIYQASMLVETLLEIAVIRDTEIAELVHRIETQGNDTADGMEQE